MQPYWVETVISQNRVLTLRGVPFRAGEKVQVIVISHSQKRVKAKRYPLRGKRIRYTAPFDSVAASEP
jgi:hypothetical protein